MWRCDVVVTTTAQLHSTKPEFRFCADSNPARGVLEIRDGEDLWQWSRLEIRINKRLSLVNHTTKTIHHHHQFIRAWFFRKNLIYLQYLKKGLKWQRRFLHVVEIFIVRFLWKCFLYYSWLVFCKNCLSGKILVLELWIKRILTSNR